MGWWTVSCCQLTRHRFHRQPLATCTCPHTAAQVLCPVPSPSEAPLVWAWLGTIPTANPTCPEPQDFICLPSTPPQRITPPMPSTVRDWAQPQPLDTSDVWNNGDNSGLFRAAMKKDSRDSGHHQYRTLRLPGLAPVSRRIVIGSLLDCPQHRTKRLMY